MKPKYCVELEAWNELVEEKMALEKEKADWKADAVKHAQEVLELRAKLKESEKKDGFTLSGLEGVMQRFTELELRLSTLLKASEGMAEWIEGFETCCGEDCDCKHHKSATQALADFRAVKEGL